MFETSQDLLNIVKAFCLLWVTVFACWLLYYGAMILKSFFEIAEKTTNALNAVEQFFTQAKAKIEHLGQNLGAVVELGKKVIDFWSEKSDWPKKKTTVKVKKEKTIE